MAISGGDGSIILTTKVDESGLKKGFGSIKKLGATAGKAFLAIGAAAGVATVAITKMATDAYADYEQLVGGVETLFKGSADKVKAYASDAFFTAGVSANEYMRQVTSFSASLIRSTAGDTDKAADIANMALIDISDNVNKMGSSMESVTLAYQGFAKQQYMLLDNLKLGYGGTKTEMERLLRDAEALTGVKYDINNLADVYSAIHVIQKELGITGTTAKEAEKTITGSANMMKAAWQNVLTAIAGGGDLDGAINNLVYSIQKYFENIVPVVERSLMGIGQLIEKVAPLLIQNVASALIKAIPNLINAVFQMIIGLAKGIYEGIKALFSGGSGTVTAQIQTSVGGISDATSDASTGMEELGDATEKAGKQAKKSLAAFDDLNIISSGKTEATEISSATIGGTGANVSVDTSALTESEGEVGGLALVLQNTFAKIAEAVNNVWNIEPVQAFVNTAKTVLGGFKLFVTTMWDNIKLKIFSTWQSVQLDFQMSNSNLTTLWTNFWNDLGNTVGTYTKPIVDAISNLFGGIWETIISPFIELVSGVWNNFTGMLVDLWDNHLSHLVFGIGDLVRAIAEGVSEIFIAIQPLIDFILGILLPVWEVLANTIWNVVGSVLGTVTDVIAGIIKVFTGLIDFIVGVFTGNWKKALNGIKTTFKGILDAIASLFKGILNVFIDIINGLISGINGAIGLINNIPGVEIPKIPKIPRLAQGTVVPPNREFLAVLGDNTKEHEIVSPISTMKRAFAEAMVEMGGSFGGGKSEIILEIDGREFGRAVVEQGNRENRRIGTRLAVV